MLSQGTSESDLVSQMEQVFDEKITQVHYITVEAVSEGFATISYVDNAISLISGGSFDPSILNDFATKEYVSNNYYDKNETFEKNHILDYFSPIAHNHDNSYYTKEEINNKIANISGGSVSELKSDTLVASLSEPSALYPHMSILKPGSSSVLLVVGDEYTYNKAISLEYRHDTEPYLILSTFGHDQFKIFNDRCVLTAPTYITSDALITGNLSVSGDLIASNIYTKEESTTAFSPVNHEHGSLYYTKGEVDNKISSSSGGSVNSLSGKIDITNVEAFELGILDGREKCIIDFGDPSERDWVEINFHYHTVNDHDLDYSIYMFEDDDLGGVMSLYANYFNIMGEVCIWDNLTVEGDLTVNGKINSNLTITHKTNVINAEIGTFCETNGGIYDGYEKIDSTDCICQVIQSNTLNPKIVGIVCSENEFASHGDVLVKVVPGTYKLGDILCPDITGKARVATETELQYMTLHAIPRPKITSLDTKIEGVVACFIF